MAITTTWIIDDMWHVDADGGVTTVYWTLLAENNSGDEYAKAGGKQRFTYDSSSSEFIAYKDLKESDVLGWIYDAHKGPVTGGPENETAAEYKARMEAERTAKVQGQLDKAATESDGLPWG